MRGFFEDFSLMTFCILEMTLVRSVRFDKGLKIREKALDLLLRELKENRPTRVTSV